MATETDTAKDPNEGFAGTIIARDGWLKATRWILWFCAGAYLLLGVGLFPALMALDPETQEMPRWMTILFVGLLPPGAGKPGGILLRERPPPTGGTRRRSFSLDPSNSQEPERNPGMKERVDRGRKAVLAGLRLMLERGGGQARVADFLGVSDRTIRFWLRGERRPAAAQAEAIRFAAREMRRDPDLGLLRLRWAQEDPERWSL